jgi:hypothetical protein
MLLLVAECIGQQSRHPVTVAGCIMNVNGEFRLLTASRTYVLKGKHDTLLGYNGKQVEVAGTVEGPSQPQGVPVVLHISKLKKLADVCQ